MMRISLHELKSLIREEAQAGSFSSAVDEIMVGLKMVDEKIVSAHEKTRVPEAQAILVGMHQDLFQLMSDFRGWVRQVKQKGG